MPLYDIKCPCGGTEGMASVAEREANNKLVECFDCGELAPSATVNRLALHGLTWPGGKYFAQAGRKFETVKEMEGWANANGFEPVSPTSRRWTDVKANSKQLNDDEAKEQGFRSSEDRRNIVKKEKHGLLERNRADAAAKAEETPSTKPAVRNLTNLA